MVWDIYGKYHDEGMIDLKVHLAIWRVFMYTTLQALISIGKEYDEISLGSKKIFISRQITDPGMSGLQHCTQTTNLEQLFGEVKSQICELSEILGRCDKHRPFCETFFDVCTLFSTVALYIHS